jgi:hypothetical protein
MNGNATRDMSESLKERSTWIRGAFMLLFTVVFGVVQFLMGGLAILQFLFLLLSGRRNDELARFGGGLANYSADIIRFTSCASERKPFPFAPWPGSQEELVRTV